VDINVDWLSFTFETGNMQAIKRESRPDVLMQRLEDELGGLITALGVHREQWFWGGGRAPYSTSLYSEGGVTVFFSETTPHFLVEVSGRGCQHIRETSNMVEFCSRVAKRCTRIDIACDIETVTTPKVFADLRDKGKFKSYSLIQSETGETVYLGSKMSERYCRAYRYNEPHPRAKMLRVEFVLKGEFAKQAAAQVATLGAKAIAVALGDTFGFVHPDWKVAREGESAILKAKRVDKHNGATMHWLQTQVIPALIRLEGEGTISFGEFVTLLVSEHFKFDEKGARRTWTKDTFERR